MHPGEPFDVAKGGGCPACQSTLIEVARATGEWEQLAVEAQRREMLDVLSYEQRFVRFADKAERLFDDERLKPMARGKYGDLTLKALRSAYEAARYRDDWVRIEYRERMRKVGSRRVGGRN